MNIQFVDRGKELDMLEKFWEKQEGIFVLWGRRRVGKTRLLREFARDKNSIFLVATKETEKGILENFSRTIGKHFGDKVLDNTSFNSFKDIIDYLGNDKSEKLLLILDEFPYLCEANESVPSVIQRAWDTGILENVNLVLCGSTVSAMESEVLGEKSPLYGRRTGQFKLHPIDPLDGKEFFPKLGVEEYLKFYSMIGGTPEYILKIDEEKNLMSNVMDSIAAPGSMLLDEPELLFKTEVREPKSYDSIMKALSFGKTTPNEISNFVGIPRTSITRYLEMLIKLDLVEKRVPITEKNPEKTRRGRYYIKDPFFRFYFRFIFPNLGEIKQGLYGVVKETVKNEFNDYMGHSFERIIENAIVKLSKKGKTPFTVQKIGPWWRKGHEIDIIALNESTKEIMFVECKWSEVADIDGKRIHGSLKEKSQFVRWGDEDRKEYYMIAGKKVDRIPNALTMEVCDIFK